ncbi:MAG: ATP-binding protein, partial [Planctomycetes bacterium]|nr:ATP-binding protein [Planctomycetota bacterium]
FGSMAPNAVFIQTEDGLSGINCHKFPLVKTFDEFMENLVALYKNDHAFSTIVVDSLDWLETLIWQHVCNDRNVSNIEDIGYGKGYHFALTQWRSALDGLNALRNEKGMQIILIAHAKIERFENPETDNYDRYAPRLHKLASYMVQEWCDNVLFASYRVHTKTSDEGFKKSSKAIGSGERIIRTTERPAHVAKNRLQLPEELPLSYEAFAGHHTQGTTLNTDTKPSLN